VALYVLFLFTYQYLASVSYNFYGVASFMFSEPTFYWVCFLVPCGSTLIELTFRLVKREFMPSIVDVATEFDRGFADTAQGLLFEQAGGEGVGRVDGDGFVQTKVGSMRSPTHAKVPQATRWHKDFYDSSSEDDDDEVEFMESGMEEAGYLSDGSITSVSSESLEATLRYSSVLHARGRYPLDWQSVKLLKATIDLEEQEALGLHDGLPSNYYNYDHADPVGNYGPGAGSSLLHREYNEDVD
jgi:hypothetical protein